MIYEVPPSKSIKCYEETQEITLHRGQQSYVKLGSPFLIKPETRYNIIMFTQDMNEIEFLIQLWQLDVTLSKNTIVTADTCTAITGLMLNI